MENDKKKKPIAAGGVSSLKNLAQKLRTETETNAQEETPISTVKKENEEELKKQELNIPQKEWDLEQFINYSKQKNYDCNAITYIDHRVKNVFAHIKANGGSVNIGKLMSEILDQWINTHKDEIKELINKNKYI